MMVRKSEKKGKQNGEEKGYQKKERSQKDDYCIPEIGPSQEHSSGSIKEKEGWRYVVHKEGVH